VKERPSGFVHVSTHDAPEEPYARAKPASLDQLAHLEAQVRVLSLDRVVLHPDSVIDWDLLCEFDIPWGIENRDARNERYGTPEELAHILDRYGLPLVLDFNHCLTRDPSLELARHSKRDSPSASWNSM
jgi:hypothetical protein